MIQLHHVHKRYENGTDALVDINLRVREGEFVFLTGASGAGKSTLLQLLLVMERVSEGQVLIGGRNVHLLRDASVPYLRRNVGLVFQDFRLIERRSVFENVAIAMEILGLARTEIRRRVMQLLGELGLEDRARAMPGDLSGGERQRVALARALANEPAILLADEPTGNLDPELSIEIMDLLLEINRRGTTVVVATHDYALVQRYGLRTVHLSDGKLHEDRPRTQSTEAAGGRKEPIPIDTKRPSSPRVRLPNPAVLGKAANLDPTTPVIQPDTDDLKPGDIQPPRRPTSGGFTATNMRISAARITGPVQPMNVGNTTGAPRMRAIMPLKKMEVAPRPEDDQPPRDSESPRESDPGAAER